MAKPAIHSHLGRAASACGHGSSRMRRACRTEAPSVRALSAPAALSSARRSALHKHDAAGPRTCDLAVRPPCPRQSHSRLSRSRTECGALRVALVSISKRGRGPLRWRRRPAACVVPRVHVCTALVARSHASSRECPWASSSCGHGLPWGGGRTSISFEFLPWNGWFHQCAVGGSESVLSRV